MSLTIPSVSFPDPWSFFNTTDTFKPGLILTRSVPFMPLTSASLSSYYRITGMPSTLGNGVLNVSQQPTTPARGFCEGSDPLVGGHVLAVGIQPEPHPGDEAGCVLFNTVRIVSWLTPVSSAISHRLLPVALASPITRSISLGMVCQRAEAARSWSAMSAAHMACAAST